MRLILLRRLLTIFIALLLGLSSYAQDSNEAIPKDPKALIRIDTIAGGFRYFVNGESVRYRQIKKIIKQDPIARYALQGHGGLNFVSNCGAFIGGYLVGFEFGTLLYGGEPRLNRLVIFLICR